MTVDVDQMPAGIELDILVAEALGYARTVPGIAWQAGHLPHLITETLSHVRTVPLTTKVIKGFAFKVVSGGCSLSDNDRVYIRQAVGDRFTYFAPSTDIAAAFQVVDSLLDGTRVFSLESWMPKKDGWQAMFKGELNWEAAQWGQLVYAYAKTRPLAICRAALKVMAEGHE